MQIVLTVTKSSFPKGKSTIKAQIFGVPVGVKPHWNNATPGTPQAAFGTPDHYADTASADPTIQYYLYNNPTGTDTYKVHVSATVQGTLLEADATLTA